MELLFENARDIKLIFRDDLVKKSEGCPLNIELLLNLEVIGIFQILTWCV